MQNDLPPPNNLTAEACTLGSMMLSGIGRAKAIGALQADDFFRPSHQIAFQVLHQMAALNIPAEAAAFVVELQKAGKYQAVGGDNFIWQIIETPNADHPDYFISIIKDQSIKRKAMMKAAALLSDLRSNQMPAGDILKSVQRELHELNQAELGSQAILQTAAQAVTASEEIIHARAENKEIGKIYLTGFRDIDRILYGLSAGHMVTLGGASSSGKSTLALNIVENIAAAGNPVLYISAEMSATELTNRMIRRCTKIQGWRLREKLNPTELQKVHEAVTQIKSLPLLFIPRAVDLAGIASYARDAMMRNAKPLALVVVDYLQLMVLPLGNSLYHQVTAMSQGLKQLAMELNCPFLVLSQFSRESGKAGKLPSMYDLKESGSIENDSNAVLLIHRPTPYDNYEGMDSDGQYYLQTWLAIDKNRDGATTGWPKQDGDPNGIRLRFYPGESRFENWV
ncbi:MAG: AAA family ATPase [Planctomycetes bacterium]|nr:AAA family ATPase [Planctomycetota bacterium]